MRWFDKYPDLIDNDRVMNGLHEYYEPHGAQLENGMVVMLSNSWSRFSFRTLKPEEIQSVIVTNRWCKVSQISVADGHVSFVGVYEDGHKVSRKYKTDEPWMVKRNSVGRRSQFDTVIGKNGYDVLFYGTPEETLQWVRKTYWTGLTVNVGNLAKIVPMEEYLQMNPQKQAEHRELQMFQEFARLGVKSDEVAQGSKAETYLKKRKEIQTILESQLVPEIWSGDPKVEERIHDALDKIMKFVKLTD